MAHVNNHVAYTWGNTAKQAYQRSSHNNTGKDYTYEITRKGNMFKYKSDMLAACPVITWDRNAGQLDPILKSPPT